MKIKILSLFEVGAIFFLNIFIFQVIQSFPLAKNINQFFGGYPVSEYLAVLLISGLAYFGRCGQARWKVALPEKLPYQLKVVAQGFFPFFVLGAALGWMNWRQWSGSILISVLTIGLIFWFAWLARDKQDAGKALVSGLVLLSMIPQQKDGFVEVLVSLVYFYLIVAFAEEFLFRGFIQTRMNDVFGRPNQFMGIEWGWGLIGSALFFGLWHLGLQTGMISWQHVLWTVFAGLLFGLVREKSRSVVAPAILHGILNYGPQAILFSFLANL